MNAVKLYAKYNNLQKTINSSLIKDNWHQLRFKDGENYLDVGCGVGESTKYLLNLVPETCNQFVGIDVSENMIEEAKILNPHDRLEYLRLDIADATMPPPLVNTFDKVFSFCALHWISGENQLQAFRNMNKLLKKNGVLFVGLVADTTVFDVYEQVHKNTKWSAYMNHPHEFSSPYNANIKGATEVLFNVLAKSGFHVELYHYKRITHNFDSHEEFSNTVKAINPFLSRIPVILQEEYWNDTMSAYESISELTKTSALWVDMIFLYAKKH